MVVAVEGARSAPAGRIRRALRRSLLIAGLAAAGWLLTALFATSASATARPAHDTAVREPTGHSGTRARPD